MARSLYELGVLVQLVRRESRTAPPTLSQRHPPCPETERLCGFFEEAGRVLPIQTACGVCLPAVALAPTGAPVPGLDPHPGQEHYKFLVQWADTSYQEAMP